MEPCSFDQVNPDKDSSRTRVTLCSVDDVPAGRCAVVELSDGNELAVFNVDGQFYVTNNSCPHKGAPLSEGALAGHVVECFWHGWQFDVRTGQCLTLDEAVESYAIVFEDGLIKIDL